MKLTSLFSKDTINQSIIGNVFSNPFGGTKPDVTHAIPKDFLQKTTLDSAGAAYTKLVEVAAIENEAVYQHFREPNGFAIHYPGGNNVLPAGWSLSGQSEHRVQIINGVVKDLTTSNHTIGKDGFGFHHVQNFAVPLAKGFSIFNITNDHNNSNEDGYDGMAIFNRSTDTLMFVNKGTDYAKYTPSLKDLTAGIADGGIQNKDAVVFMETTFKMMGGHIPLHVSFTGHSLGGATATAQAAYFAQHHSNNFDLITFDSIGDSKLVKDMNLSAATLHTLTDNHLSFMGSGKLDQLPLLNAHLFKETTAGTTELFPNILHDMTHFTPHVFSLAE